MTTWYDIKTTEPPNRVPVIVWDADDDCARPDEWFADIKRWATSVAFGVKPNITHWTILEKPDASR